MEAGTPFVACDNPHATPLTIHILAAVAEDEAKRIAPGRKPPWPRTATGSASASASGRSTPRGFRPGWSGRRPGSSGPRCLSAGT